MEKSGDLCSPDQKPCPAGANSSDSFVFLDARGERWPRLRRILFGMGLLFFIRVVLFAQTLLLPSQLSLPPAVQQLNFSFIGNQSGVHSPFKKEPVPETAYLQEIRLGFCESWDPDSLDSLKGHADILTHFCPGWLTVADARGRGMNSAGLSL